MDKIKEYFYLFKVHHWVKNLIIFLPLCVGQPVITINFINYIIYFFILSLLSSIIYFFNNVNDYKEDRINKKLKYSLNLDNKRYYYFFGFLSFTILVIFSYFINQTVLFICIIYFFLSLSYNFYLKEKKYIDIFILALFHILRIVYGSIAFQVNLSLYFILFCSAIFLMIGSNKRFLEIEKSYINRPYKESDKNRVHFFRLLFSFLAILVFFFYSIDPNKNQFFIHKELIFLNLLLIIMIILNFLFFQKEKNQDIVMFIYKNKINFILVLSFFIIYVGNSVSFYN